MLLTIDVGNTNSVFAIWDGDTLCASWRTSTEATRTADQYFVWLTTLMNARGERFDITDMIISATAPRVVFNLRVLADRYFGTRPLVVGKPETALPMVPRVDPGAKVGPDRLANSVGAYARHGGDLVIVDFGTATNFDVVDSDGAYIGGVIAPGVNLSLEALHQAAAALPHVDVSKPARLIGRNTVDCMQSGIFWGYIGLVSGLTAQIRAEHGREMKIIGTGGLAPLYASGAPELFDTVEEDLTIYGLMLIHAHNQKISTTQPAE